MDTLHEHGYVIGKAALSMITTSGPVICKDEGEDWSAAEANLFEEAIDKFGKDFNEIRKEYVRAKFIYKYNTLFIGKISEINCERINY